MAKKRDKTGGSRGEPHPMTRALSAIQHPDRTSFDDAWLGLEPTFQSRKSIQRWEKLATDEAGEDAYFESKYMLKTMRQVADDFEDRYRAERKKGKSYCPFARVERSPDRDPWDVARQELRFHWDDPDLPAFEVRFGMDPETWEYSIKPTPAAWLYEDDFIGFLDQFVWGAPLARGLTTSIAHGGGQSSISAKVLMGGSLLADEIAYRLNHPELSTLIMDAPSADGRPFRATRKRFNAFRDVLRHYWAGGFHPTAVGVLTAGNAILDRGWSPNAAPPGGLMDAQRGPIGDDRDVFQTNFAFGRALRWQAQIVHAGYWQGAHHLEVGYRPDQIMRYTEANLNRLQIAGECHVKDGHTLDKDRVPEFDAPLEISMLYDEASYEDRAQMSRTSARDFVEAVLLDLHHLRYLAAHPGVKVNDSILQDQLLGDGEATIEKHAGPARLAELRQQARESNLDESHGRVHSDFVEPETIFWAAWKALPGGERAAIAHEAVAAFVERVVAAAQTDPRSSAKTADPMEWHRHRIHPILWAALDSAGLKAKDPVRRELDLWKARREEYLARRPVYSPVGRQPPWEEP